VTAKAPQTGAFMDFDHLVRLQRLMHGVRERLTRDYPTLRHGERVCQTNMPLLAEYAFGKSFALQAWYRDPTLHWMRFDAFRDSLATPVTTIVQGQGGHAGHEVALVEPEAVRLLYKAQPFLQSDHHAEALALLDRADSLQRDTNAFKYRVTSGTWRAYAWVWAHRDSEAVVLTRHVLAMDPKHVVAYQVLALALANRGDLVGALREVSMADALAPNDAATTALRAQIESRIRASFNPAAAPRASPPAR